MRDTGKHGAAQLATWARHNARQPVISVRVTPAERDELLRLSAEAGRSLSAFCRQIVTERADRDVREANDIGKG